jgi:GATA zinc finger
MLRGLTQTPTGVSGHPTCLLDEPIGVNRMVGFEFDHESKDEAGRDFRNHPLMTQNMSGPPSRKDSSPELELGGGALPWLNGPPIQFYAQDVQQSNRQTDTQDAFYGSNTAVLPSNYSWEHSEDFSSRLHLATSSLPAPTFTTPYDQGDMFPVGHSTSNHISHADFAGLSQNRDMFEPSSPVSPTSPSNECDFNREFSSKPVPTLPSSEVDPPPARKLSQVSSSGSVGSEKREPVSCSNCSTNNTSLWRRTHDGVPVCNACGLFMRLHGIPRPLSLKTDVVKKRKRQRASGPNSHSGGKPGGRTRAARHFAREPSISEHTRG